jgi:hypothetical protein
MAVLLPNVNRSEPSAIRLSISYTGRREHHRSPNKHNFSPDLSIDVCAEGPLTTGIFLIKTAVRLRASTVHARHYPATKLRNPLMKTWVQRIRGAVGIGLTWATGWAPIGAITGWVTATVLGFPLATVATNYAVMFGMLGFTGGAIFSTVLGVAEGHRSFGELSLPRFVTWGAIGGLLLGGLAATAGLLGSAFTVLGAVIVGVSTLLGAGSAASTLAIAKAAEDRALLTEGEERAPARLSEASGHR